MSSLSQERRVIVTSAMVTLTVGFLAGIERGEGLPTARLLIGTGMAFTICSIMTDLGSPMGAGFAGLIMVASLMYQGEDAFRILSERSKPTKASKKKTKKATNKVANQTAAAIAAGMQAPEPPEPINERTYHE